jgi:Holliday junction resolvase RusA-like endonuclease
MSFNPEVPKSVRIVLAGQPIGKGRPRVTRTGRLYTPEKTIRYEDRLALAAQEAMNGGQLFDCQLFVKVEAHLQIPVSWSHKKRLAALVGTVRPLGKPDLDNFIKSLDGLNGVVWVDDARVVEISASKFYSDAPRLEVVVSNHPIFFAV